MWHSAASGAYEVETRTINCHLKKVFVERELEEKPLSLIFFKPFLMHLLTTKLAASTLRRHRDHLWMLRDEVIRRRQEDSQLCKLPVDKITFELLEEDGGPLIWPRITKQEQDAFDASCRKLYRYLTTASDGNSS